MPGRPGRIFISYRREDTAYPAGWLFDRLASHFGRDQIFKDVDSIKAGDNFVDMISTAVASCDVLLALIGDRWLTITDQRGRQRRLDKPDDMVRLEIETALTRNVLVIPILVAGAQMPRANQLPASLAKLADRQALQISPNRFESDLQRLLGVLDKTITERRRATAEQSGPRTLAAMLNPPKPPWFMTQVYSVAFSADAQLLASGGADSKVRLWNPASGQQLKALDVPGVIYSVAFSADGWMFASSAGRKVLLWNLASSQLLRTITAADPLATVRSVAFSPDGRLLASAGTDGMVRLWDPVSGQQLNALTGHTGSIQSLAFSPNRLLASAGDDTVRLWDPAGGQLLRLITDGKSPVAFSADGRLLASGSADSMVRLWDPASGQQLNALAGHTASIQSVTFSRDGLLASGGESDQMVWLWDPADGRQLRAFTKHEGTIYSVAFSPDGRLLASADKTNVRLWR